MHIQVVKQWREGRQGDDREGEREQKVVARVSPYDQKRNPADEQLYEPTPGDQGGIPRVDVDPCEG
jgi:hypothetical protein